MGRRRGKKRRKRERERERERDRDENLGGIELSREVPGESSVSSSGRLGMLTS